MEEYMGDVEDPQTLQAQFRELMEDVMFVIPALQVAHFQREYICNNKVEGGNSELWVPGEHCSARVWRMLIMSLIPGT